MLSGLFMLLAFEAVSVQAPPPPQTQLGCPGSRVTRPLTFNYDGTFQISIFNDLHFGESRCLLAGPCRTACKSGLIAWPDAWDSWGPQQDINSVKVINEVLDRESPGLVVLNGDLITGENTFRENSTVYIDQLVRPMLQRGLQWAASYGNHDHDFNISAEAILAREQRWPNALTRSMVPGRLAGVSNYYLPVYPPECDNCGCAPEMLLWFFDSRGGFYYQERNADGTRRGMPGWVDTSVVDWFRATNAGITARFGKAIPSLAFVHIPTNASLALQMEHGRDSINPNLQPGINDDYPLAQQGQGWCSDGRNDGSCAYGGQDVPFMQALVTTPGLIAVFSGHDHGDTWCYKWDHLVPGMTVAGNGVNLCFGQHSGYGGYGHWIRGSRQVRVSREILNKSWEAETWIRLESGNVVGSVCLNATYGKDLYPATPNDMTYCPTCNYRTNA
ncbi:inactive purple acid phosphatase 16 [Tolypocladium capitatum]|uniref:Inactive purple acid phosphatase 16 n=1 Tax=Tolypocladium capitatum TaxID=45235 RepID=A0A2K3Q9H7_9HYPO|nr:inactive purple acid phosphatase 16 [Tolypocladium capitatum]